MVCRHIDLIRSQTPKGDAALCGDLFSCRRDPQGTTVMLADGMGSGPRAHLSAEWYSTRFHTLMEQGYSVRKAFDALCHTLSKSRGRDPIWAALMVARIRPDGEATILAHEMPSPLLLTKRHATVLPHHAETRAGCLVEETLCYLQPGEGLLLCSDGVSQSGMRESRGRGWSAEAMAAKVTEWMRDGLAPDELPKRLRREAQRRWQSRAADDISAGLLLCRTGRVLNLLTGPPVDRRHDAEVIGTFMKTDGYKIVCGATTASLVARHTGTTLSVAAETENPHVPPEYRLEGVDLATEGTVTLSQVCRLLETDVTGWDAKHAVARLVTMLQLADTVRITAGLAVNRANEDFVYRQIGVLTRRELVRTLRTKLQALGKTVDVHWA